MVEEGRGEMRACAPATPEGDVDGCTLELPVGDCRAVVEELLLIETVIGLLLEVVVDAIGVVTKVFWMVGDVV